MAIHADSLAPFSATSPHHTIAALPSFNPKDGKEYVLSAPLNTLMQDAMRLFARVLTAVVERRTEWKQLGGAVNCALITPRQHCI